MYYYTEVEFSQSVTVDEISVKNEENGATSAISQSVTRGADIRWIQKYEGIGDKQLEDAIKQM